MQNQPPRNDPPELQESQDSRQPLDFGPDLQRQLLHLILLDGPRARELVKHLDPHRDFAGPLQWVAERIVDSLQRYQAVPDRAMLMDQAQRSGADAHANYAAAHEVFETRVTAAGYLKDHLLDWTRRNIARRQMPILKAAFNDGDPGAWVEVLESLSREVHQTRWDAPDRSWFFEELGPREARRMEFDQADRGIPTGISAIDQVLGGGITKTQLCAWIAYPKVGKSMVLLNHGVMAVRMGYRVLHIILEDTRQNLERRYDANLTGTRFRDLAPGGRGIAPDKYSRSFLEYQQFHGQLVLESYTGRGEVTVDTIRETLHDLRVAHGWVPDLTIVDYCDLLSGEGRQPYERQVDACRKLKNLTNEGHRTWTAFQANFDGKTSDTVEHIVGYGQVAGGKEKIRIVDFVGSLNATAEEREKLRRLRIAPLIYRSGAVPQKEFYVTTNSDMLQLLPSTQHGALGYGA